MNWLRKIRSLKLVILVWLFLISKTCGDVEIVELRPGFIGIQTTITTTTKPPPTTTLTRNLASAQNMPINLEETPDTILNIKLTTESIDCNNSIELNWYTFESNTDSIIGFKIFVREYAEKPLKLEARFFTAISTGTTKLTSTIYKQTNETTVITTTETPPQKFNAYNSKLIGTHQNKFKLKNLLRTKISYYYICLVVFSDDFPANLDLRVSKKCANIALPALPEDFDNTVDFCKTTRSNAWHTSKTSTKLSTNILQLSSQRHERTSPLVANSLITATTTASTIATTSVPLIRNFSLNLGQSLTKLNKLLSNKANSFLGLKSKKFNETRAESIFHCKHYTNLLIAFIVCIALLATNVFMFTIIIIQNTIKLNLLKNKIRLNKINSQFYCLSNNSSSYSLVNKNDIETKRTSKNGRNCFCRFLNSISSCLGKVCCDFSEIEVKKAEAHSQAMNRAARQNRNHQQHKQQLHALPRNGQNPNMHCVSNDVYKKKKRGNQFLHGHGSSRSSVITKSREGYILNFPNTGIYPGTAAAATGGAISSACVSGYSQSQTPLIQEQSQQSLLNPRHLISNASFSNPIVESDEQFSFVYYNPNNRNISHFSNDIFFNAPNRFRNSQASSAF